MPKAAPLNPLDQADVEFARKYVQGTASLLLGSPLEQDSKSPWLVSQQGETFNVCLLEGRNRQNGMYCLVFDSGMNPLHGQYGAKWMVLVDAAQSEVMLLDAARWQRQVDDVLGNPNGHAGMLSVVRQQTWLFVWVNPSWLADSGLVDKKVKGKPYASMRNRAMAGREDFVHLHVHSTYSMLDGVSDVEMLPVRALENGQSAIALTDHGYLYGAFKFYQACRDVKVKPIVGCEFYLVDDVTRKYTAADGTARRFEHHQTVLAMDPQGWENLCELATLACRDHFYHVPRIDLGMLFERNAGLIVLSGCFKGAVAWYLQQHDPETAKDLPWHRFDPDRSRQYMRAFKQAFGDRYFCELQAIDYPRYMQAMPLIAQLAADEGVPCVVTNDCHYELAEDASLQSLLSRVSGGDGVGDGIGSSRAETGPYFIKSRGEIQSPVFTTDMYDRTCEIAGRCALDLGFKGYLFPPFDLTADADWAAFQQATKP